jgi:hypothetical protein
MSVEAFPRGLKHEGQSRHAKIEVGVVPSRLQAHVQGGLGGHHDNEGRPRGPPVAFTQRLTNGGKAFTCDGHYSPWLGVGAGRGEGRGAKQPLYLLDGQRVGGDAAPGATCNELGKDVHEMLLSLNALECL